MSEIKLTKKTGSGVNFLEHHHHIFLVLCLATKTASCPTQICNSTYLLAADQAPNLDKEHRHPYLSSVHFSIFFFSIHNSHAVAKPR